MRARNLTPFLFGTKVTSRMPPQLEMTMIVRGSFALRPKQPMEPIDGLAGGLLEQGPLTAEVFAEEDEDRLGACLYPGDLADYKPNAELFLLGSCHVEPGKPVRECGVRFAVESWSKALLVVGKRTWGVLGPSAPEPFEKMPLGWDRSFGGPSYDKNPSGKGLGTAELPNVEAPASRVTGKSDRPEPAGFGALNPAWPQRAAKTGKAMFKGRPPYFVEGVDWSRFNAAPPDQQLKAFLRGDEEITLQNLVQGHPVFVGRLPGLRIRGFSKVADGAVSEARFNLDTLLVDTDKGHLVLTWRGHVPCSETDLSDVKSVLIASEKLADAPKSAEHYRKALEEFHADPIGVLADEVIPGARKTMAAGKAMVKDMAENPDRPQEERALELLANEDLMTFGLPEGERAEAMKRAGANRDQLKEALAKKEEALAKQEEQLAKAQKTVADAGGPDRPIRPPSVPEKTANELAEEAPDVRAQIKDALKTSRGEVEKALTKLEAASPEAREKIQSKLDELDALDRKMDEDPLFKRGLAMATPPKAAEVGPGKDLSYRNMTRRDFSGLDLSGANFEGAILTNARLVGARLSGACFREAMVTGADLTGADLTGADFTRAMLTGVKAPDADFSRATFHSVILSNADLRRAKFSGAKLVMGALSGCDLTEAKLDGAELEKVFADDARVERADFSGARLVKTTFMRSKLGSAVFKKAILTNASFLESDLTGAIFVEAAGEHTNWMKADLAGADFRFAVLRAAHFMETKAVGTNFYGADLRGSEFIRACLERSLFRKANLFGANLDKALLTGTSFLDANLYEAKLATARVKDTIFVGANTKKAEMPA